MTSDPTPTGCFLPLHAAAVHPQGFPHFCLTSTLKTGGSLASFAAERLAIHETLLKGEWPESCMRCRRQEQKGIQSRRTGVWQRKIKMYGREKAQKLVREEKRFAIRHLDISFSNVCNLSCAMCSSEFSSGWIAPDKAAIEKNLPFREFTKPFHRVSRISDTLIQEVLAHVEELDLVIIKGGEPTREPLCLKFLADLAQARKKPGPYVFIQSNGTRDPQEWITGLDKLHLDVGVSLDGWGRTNDWIRGAQFDKILAHIEALDAVPFVKSLTVDFTLSAFNVFQLPQYLREILALRSRLHKPFTCPVFQWVQQSYASPLTLRDEDRAQILAEVRPLLEENAAAFVNPENLLRVLGMPRANEISRKQCADWMNYVEGLRGFALPDRERVLASIQN